MNIFTNNKNFKNGEYDLNKCGGAINDDDNDLDRSLIAQVVFKNAPEKMKDFKNDRDGKYVGC